MPVHTNTRVRALAVNFVRVTDKLDTAGQPDREQLGRLAERGYGMVINLAPPHAHGYVETEGRLVAQAGIAYVNIPVEWERPQYSDFELFSGVLDQAGERKVLVHCMLNMRGSMFVFLYRVVHQMVPPAEAYRFVRKVWIPNEQWRAFGRMVLSKHNFDFEFPDK